MISAAPSAVYSYVWNVGSACRGIPGLSTCNSLGNDTYRFEYNTSSGPLTLNVRYTAKFVGNGRDRIDFFSSNGKDEDTAEVEGFVSIRTLGPNQAEVTLRQAIVPETPVPRFLPNLVRAYVESSAAAVVEAYLAKAKRQLERTSAKSSQSACPTEPLPPSESHRQGP